MQLCMLLHMALHEHRALLRIKPCREKVQGHLARVLSDLRRIGVVGGEGVPVSDKEVALVLMLQAHPVVECSHVIAQMELAGGAHTAQHTLPRIRRRDRHSGPLYEKCSSYCTERIRGIAGRR